MCLPTIGDCPSYTIYVVSFNTSYPFVSLFCLSIPSLRHNPTQADDPYLSRSSFTNSCWSQTLLQYWESRAMVGVITVLTQTYPGFHKWGYPNSWLVYNGKCIYKWMIEGYPHDLGNLHMFLDEYSILAGYFPRLDLFGSTRNQFIDRSPTRPQIAGKKWINLMWTWSCVQLYPHNYLATFEVIRIYCICRCA